VELSIKPPQAIHGSITMVINSKSLRLLFSVPLHLQNNLFYRLLAFYYFILGASRSAEMTLDDLLEGALEVFVEVRVDDGVEQRVGVAQPVDHVLQPAGHVARARAKRHHQGDDEEGQPAEDEGAHDDAQSLHRFALARHGDLLLGLRRLLVAALEQRHAARRRVGQRQVALEVAAVHFDDLQRLAVLRVLHRAVDAH